nr:MAG TPA: hypothetical protein [Caudoviricetes sp.]
MNTNCCSALDCTYSNCVFIRTPRGNRRVYCKFKLSRRIYCWISTSSCSHSSYRIWVA